MLPKRSHLALFCICVREEGPEAHWLARIGVVTFAKEFVNSPDAVTGLLSQIPTLLLEMWLKAIVVVTGAPPENTRIPVVTRS